MAKGLRSSVKKANRSKLRSRVFQPVETARTERLHAKLLEAVNQPRPEPRKNVAKMDIGSAQGIASTNEQSSTSGSLSYICEAPPDAEEPTDNAEYPKGWYTLSTPIPQTISFENEAHRDHFGHVPYLRTMEECQHESDQLYLYLGLCSDVVGFDRKGQLQLAFDTLALDEKYFGGKEVQKIG